MTKGASGSRARVGAGAGEYLCGEAAIVLHRRRQRLGVGAAVEAEDPVLRMAAGTTYHFVRKYSDHMAFTSITKR